MRTSDESSPRVLGLLGGVSAGKSTVAEAFARKGAIAIDADQIARSLLADPDLQSPLADLFGAEIFLESGQPDRQKIAAAVFGPAGAEKRRALEALLHPRVRERLREALAQARRNKSAPCILLDVPLLLESPLRAECDHLLFVDTPLPLREARAQRDRGWAAGEVQRREAAQTSLAEKRAAADLRLDNSGNPAELEAAVQRILDGLRPRHGGTS